MADLDEEMLGAMLNAQDARWDTVTELLATLVEITDRNGRWFYQANCEKGAASPDPVEIRRPGSVIHDAGNQGNRPATAEEMKAFFCTP